MTLSTCLLSRIYGVSDGSPNFGLILKETFMVAFFTDHYLKLFGAYQSSIEKTSPDRP